MTNKQFRILAVLTLVSGFLGGAVSDALLRGAPAAAQGGGAVQEVVVSKTFKVVDSEGRGRAYLGTLSDGSVGLTLFDAGANNGISMAVLANGRSALTLNHGGKTRGALGILPSGSPGLTLADADGTQRAMLAVAPDGTPGLGLGDVGGSVQAMLTVPRDGGPGLVLLDSTNRPIWKAP